jgi:hypothetical protein
MTKLASALGKKYEANKDKIFTRTFDLGGHIFKVRVPFVHETDEIFEKINNPNSDDVEKVYQELVEPIMQYKEMESDFVFTDDDVLVGERSLRQSAKLKLQTEIKITEFIKLLVPENPEDSLADLTYEEINNEFPLSVQMQLVEKISEAISPTYKEIRGN